MEEEATWIQTTYSRCSSALGEVLSEAAVVDISTAVVIPILLDLEVVEEASDDRDLCVA